MKSIIASVVILSVVAAVSGLQCYICNSHRDPACGDLFHYNSNAIQNAYLMTCNESEGGPKPFCRKTKTTFEINGEVRVHRECAYNEREEYACYQQRAEDYINDVCQCHESLCNGAQSIMVATMALFIPITIAALL